MKELSSEINGLKYFDWKVQGMKIFGNKLLRKAFRLGGNEELYEAVSVSKYYGNILSRIREMWSEWEEERCIHCFGRGKLI